MGITIHYDGATKNLGDIGNILGYVTFFAKSLKWEIEPFKEKGIARIEKVFDWDTGKVSFQWLSFVPDKYLKRDGVKVTKDYLKKVDGEKSERFGVVVNPSDPFVTESFVISFYKYKGEYHLKDFCKTQVFSEKERPNLIVHQILIGVLLAIKNTWLSNLDISDEGDYFVPFTRKEREVYAKKSISEDYQKAFIEKEPFNFEELVKSQVGNFNLINTVGKVLGNFFSDVRTGGEIK